MSVRIAVLGAGLIGRRHVELVAAHPQAELAAIVDPAPASKDLAMGHGASHFESLDSFLACGLVDAPIGATAGDLGVIVATPNADHVSSALKCLEAGIAVLVEKPIADTVEDGRRLVEASSAKSRVLIGHHRRHSSLRKAAQQVIDDGVLGALVVVQGSAVFYKPDDYFQAAPWRTTAGGGPILINMIHEVDDLRGLCGDIESVQAIASSRTRRFEVEDSVAIALEFASGVLGTFLLSDAGVSARSWDLTSQENPAYPSHPNENCFELAGTRGSLSVPTMTLRTYAGKSSWWEPLHTESIEVRRVDPLAAQLDHFVEVVSGAAAPTVTAADALVTLATTLAIAEAAKTGRAVQTQEMLRPTQGLVD